MVKVLLSNNPDNLEAELKKYSKTATVEAEYGDRTVYGSVVTLAHHGEAHKDKLPPCVAVSSHPEVEAIGISHIDLDTVGGVLGIMGKQPQDERFWLLAGALDVNGIHRGPDQPWWHEHEEDVYAWIAWAQNNRVFAPQDGSVKDVTDYSMTAGSILRSILEDQDEELLQAGRDYQSKEAMTNYDSLVEFTGGVILRVSPVFTNHLYRDFEGNLAEAVLAYNTRQGSITLSFENNSKGLSARKIVQHLWGEEAGGHDGIAESPRGKRMSLLDLVRCQNEVLNRLGVTARSANV